MPQEPVVEERDEVDTDENEEVDPEVSIVGVGEAN
jgi:hypothetical protein